MDLASWVLPRTEIKRYMNISETKMVNSEEINCYIWEKKKILVLSIVYRGQMKEFERHNSDNPRIPIRLKRPCCAYILYKLTWGFKPLTPFNLRMQLFESLLEKYMGDSEEFENISRKLNQEWKAELHRMRRTTERHFLTEIIAPDDEPNKDVRKDCHHCSNRTKKDKRERTRYICEQCRVALCPGKWFKT